MSTEGQILYYFDKDFAQDATVEYGNNTTNHSYNIEEGGQIKVNNFPKGLENKVFFFHESLGSYSALYHTPRGISKRSVLFPARYVELHSTMKWFGAIMEVEIFFFFHYYLASSMTD